MNFGDTLAADKGVIQGAVTGGVVLPGGHTRFESLNGPLILPGQWLFKPKIKSNLVLYDWAFIVGQLMRGSPDGKNYAINGMYLEFENNSALSITNIPTVTRADGLAYYEGLASHAKKDYLRVPIAGATLTSTDADLYPNGNKVTFIAQSSGTTGVTGNAFSNAADSVVYGGALVAMRDENDATQDVVLSRFYFENAGDQLVKQTGSQITLTWPLTLQ